MKLQEPYTGTVVTVADEVAERYMARGFKPVEKPKKEAAEKPAAKPRRKRA